MNKKDKKYYVIVIVAALIYLLPGLFLYALVSMYETQRKDQPGLIRLQPGQTIIVDLTEAETNPLNRPILVAENLNRELSSRAIYSPTTAARIKSATPEELKEILVEDPEEEKPDELRELLEAATNYGLIWNPQASPWGMFHLPSENPPTEGGLPFGAVGFGYGMERTRYNTEKRLNSIINELEKEGNLPRRSLALSTEPITELLTRASQYAKVEKWEISPLLAASEVLNIKYNPERDIFASKYTLNEMLPWIEKSGDRTIITKKTEDPSHTPNQIQPQELPNKAPETQNTEQL